MMAAKLENLTGIVRKPEEIERLVTRLSYSFMEASESKYQQAEPQVFRKIPTGFKKTGSLAVIHGDSLFIDIGGSNTKVYLKAEGKSPKLLLNINNKDLNKRAKAAADVNLIELYAANLFAKLNAEGAVDLKGITKLGIGWSNPFTVKKLPDGKIAGVTGKVAGKSKKGEWFTADMKDSYDLGKPFRLLAKASGMKLKVFAVTNDSPLPLMAEAKAQIGGVASTGTNYVMVDPKTGDIYVSECGGFTAPANEVTPSYQDQTFVMHWTAKFGKGPTNEELSARCGMTKQFLAAVSALSVKDSKNFKAFDAHFRSADIVKHFQDQNGAWNDDLIQFLFKNPKYPGDDKLPEFLQAKEDLIDPKSYTRLRAVALDVIKATGQYAGILAAASASSLTVSGVKEINCALDSSCAGIYSPVFFDAAERAYKTGLKIQKARGSLIHLKVGPDGFNPMIHGAFKMLDSIG